MSTNIGAPRFDWPGGAAVAVSMTSRFVGPPATETSRHWAVGVDRKREAGAKQTGELTTLDSSTGAAKLIDNRL
jgi:hypothetical protein